MARSRSLVLEAAASEVVKNLGGIWRDGGAMCRCPAHEDDTPSLSVRVGDVSLLFNCFAGCTVPEILRAIRRRRLAIPSIAPDFVSRPADPNPAMVSRARYIWDTASSLRGTPGQIYLRSRGITIEAPRLRFSPRTPLGPGRSVQFRPAIIAPIHEGRRLVAIQRIFLDRAGAVLAADLDRAKLALGRPMAGAVQLAPATQVLGLAEGVETALSAMILLGIPVWAAPGSERLGRISLPDIVERLVLLPDNDRAGRRSVPRAEAAYARPGRRIETHFPWFGLNDWNDVLQTERRSFQTA